MIEVGVGGEGVSGVDGSWWGVMGGYRWRGCG